MEKGIDMRLLYILPLLAIALGAACTYAGDLLHRRTRVMPRCGIPCYAYTLPQARASTAEVTELALPVQLRQDTVTPVRGGLKVYQLRVPQLQLDHCSISEVAISVRDDGTLICNLRATQDPTRLPPNVQPTFERFKRNRFSVRVRALTVAQIGETPDRVVVGKPVLYEFPIDFWLERGQSETIVRQFNYPRPDDNFPIVQRFEVEFRYE